MNQHVTVKRPASDVVVGKDVLELVSSAMYVDPLAVFREYVQNAADSIDEARQAGLIADHHPGRVDITLAPLTPDRMVKIRDNGAGVPNADFVRLLTAIGGSHKRGTSARGFRGVGRLAGLGYCQELIFRSRARGDEAVLELRWDCRVFKKLLADSSYEGGLGELIEEVVSVKQLDPADWPAHFFEVEMVKPIRIKNDLLLNRDEIRMYLSKVAPVPFAPDFKFGPEIRQLLQAHLPDFGEIHVHVDGSDEPLYRPYRNDYAYAEGKRDAFSSLEVHHIEGMDGGIAAVTWLLHHGYHGAIPKWEGVNGLRARKGNIQIGDHRIFSEAFPEARFASWAVGEVHVIDDRVLPNGRRDNFEQNPRYNHLMSRLTEVGHQVGRRCRSSSVVRNRLKSFEVGAAKVDEQLSVLEQGALGDAAAEALVGEIRGKLHEMKKVSEAGILSERDRTVLSEHHLQLEARLSKAETREGAPDGLAAVPEHERSTVSRMIELIYDCSSNRVAAKSLVDRILARLGEPR